MDVDWAGENSDRYDTYDHIDSVYFIGDSLMILKIGGANFFNKHTGDNNYNYVYYTIPLNTKKITKLPDYSQFEVNRKIRNNNRMYLVKYPDPYHYPNIFEILKRFFTTSDKKAEIDLIQDGPAGRKYNYGFYYRLNYNGWKQENYVYNLKRAHESIDFPKIKLGNNCKKYGAINKITVSQRDTIKRRPFKWDIGYYFPVNNDTMIFYDRLWYYRAQGVKAVVIPKQEMTFGYCFVNRKDSTFKMVLVNIPRTYNKIKHPGYLFELPLSLIFDIPIQVLWLPFGIASGIFPETDMLHR
jgi:hypothetical protein